MIKKTSTDNTLTSYYGIKGFGQINEIRSPGVYDYAHPDQIGKMIQTEQLNLRFASVPVTTEAIVREIPVWQSLPRSIYQKLDMIRRKSRLYKDKIL